MTTTRSLRATLGRAAVKAVVITAALGGSYATADALNGSNVVLGEGAEPPALIQPADPTQALVKRHDCWTGEAPADMAGVIPGHVVIRYDGDTTATYRGSRAVGDALAFLFDGADNGVAAVAGFCR